MKDTNSLIVKKQGVFEKIINKFRSLFYKNNKVEEIPIVENINYQEKKETFINSIRISIDGEIPLLKLKLESGEIKAIELTDKQIEQLQKIYDEEILQKRMKLEKLKKKA